MPFEVKAVEGGNNRRSTFEVANDIKKFYERIAELGGTVIAGYNMTEETRLYQGVYFRASTLFLVGEVPDES